jgi:hypothetical protein
MVLSRLEYNGTNFNYSTGAGVLVQEASAYVEPASWLGGTNKALRTTFPNGSAASYHLAPKASDTTMQEGIMKMGGKTLHSTFTIPCFGFAFFKAAYDSTFVYGITLELKNGRVYKNVSSLIGTCSPVTSSDDSHWYDLEVTLRIATGPKYVADVRVYDNSDNSKIGEFLDTEIYSGTLTDLKWAAMVYQIAGAGSGSQAVIDGLRWKVTTA